VYVILWPQRLEIFLMIIFLPPELETLVKRQIESGKFENAIDAIFAGMNLLGQKDD